LVSPYPLLVNLVSEYDPRRNILRTPYLLDISWDTFGTGLPNPLKSGWTFLIEAIMVNGITPEENLR
jgi:hypothetical protein